MHTCINTGMIAMVKTLNLFTRERVIVGRERTKRLYDTSAYVLSKVRRAFCSIEWGGVAERKAACTAEPHVSPHWPSIEHSIF
jgi:hypothetical protein